MSKTFNQKRKQTDATAADERTEEKKELDDAEATQIVGGRGADHRWSADSYNPPSS